MNENASRTPPRSRSSAAPARHALLSARRGRAVRSALAATLLPTFVLAGFANACSDTQRFGDEPTPSPPATPSSTSSSSDYDRPTRLPTSTATRRWEWLNPRPTGEALLGIGGTSDHDVWLVGARGTVLHWDGHHIEVPLQGVEDTTFHAVWTSGPDDVWLFGDTAQGSRLLRWNGATWSEQLGLAGKRVATVSSGSTKRFIVLIDTLSFHATWEYDRSSGAWVELSEGPVATGVATDVWVDETGDAWVSCRSSRFFRRCRLGKVECERVQISKDLDLDAFGIWGSSPSDIHAFYTEPKVEGGGLLQQGIRSLHFDGSTWKPREEVDDFIGGYDPLSMSARHSPPAGTSDGRRMAFVEDGIVTYVPPAVRQTPAAYTVVDTYPLEPSVVHGPRATAIWTSPSGTAYAVGEFGMFVRYDPTTARWVEILPSVREKVGPVSLALDGGRLSFTRTSVLRWSADRWQSSSIGEYEELSGVRAFSSQEAWVATGGGIGRWTASGGMPVRYLLTGGSFVQALWGEGDATWAATLGSPPDLSYVDWKDMKGSLCTGTKTLAPGKLTPWTCRATNHRTFSISGTSASDVWFAGDELMHWNGAQLETSAAFPAADRQFAGVHARGPKDVWLWGKKSFHFDGTIAVPLAEALGTTTDVGDGNVLSITSDAAGNLYVLVSADTTPKPTDEGPSAVMIYRYLREDGSFTLDRTVDAPLRTLTARGDEIWATGERGATLRLRDSPSPR